MLRKIESHKETSNLCDSRLPVIRLCFLQSHHIFHQKAQTITTTVKSWWRNKIAFLLTWVSSFSLGCGATYRQPWHSLKCSQDFFSCCLGWALILSNPSCLLQQKKSSVNPLRKGTGQKNPYLIHYEWPDQGLTVCLYTYNAKIILEQKTSFCYIL